MCSKLQVRPWTENIPRFLLKPLIFLCESKLVQAFTFTSVKFLPSQHLNFIHQLHTSQVTKLCFKLHSQRTETCCLRSISITHFQQIRQSRVIRATCLLLLPGPVYTLQEVFDFSIQKRLKRTLPWYTQILLSFNMVFKVISKKIM